MTIRLRTLALIAGIVAAAPGTASAVDGPSGVALLNAQRAANGIPGDLVEDDYYSDGCRKHKSQYVETDTQNPHDEVEGQPGYTEEGQAAARGSMLSGGSTWSPTANPWTAAPLHLSGLFDPASTSAWYGEGRYGACMGTRGRREFDGPAFFSLPGDGTAGVPRAERANESPFTPQEAADIRAHQTTGPNLILFPMGIESPLIAAASITAADGTPVEVRWADASSKSPTSNNPNLPSAPTLGDYGTTGYLIPVRPLKVGTAYTANITWTDAGGSTYPQRVSFRTGPRDGGPTAIGPRELGFDLHAGRLTVNLYRGLPREPITATITKQGGQPQTLTLQPDPRRHKVRSDKVIDAGRYEVCINIPQGTYDAHTKCGSRVNRGSLSDYIDLRRPRPGFVTLRVSGPAVGLTATVNWLAGQTPDGFYSSNVIHRVRLRTGTMRLEGPATARSGAVYLSIKIPGVRIGGARYEGFSYQGACWKRGCR